MVSRIQITDENLVDVIHSMQLLPVEIERARKWAQLQAGKYARQETRRTFRERTGIGRQRSRRRLAGSKARAWLGGSPIPIREIKGLVIVRNNKVLASTGGRSARGNISREHVKRWFVLNVPGKPIYERVGAGSKAIQAVKWPISQETYQAADDVIPGTIETLQTKFRERAEKIITEGNAARNLSSYKGKTEDRLSSLKFFRTTLR